MSAGSGNRKNWQWMKPNWLESISLIQLAKPRNDSKQSIATCDWLHAHSQFDTWFCSALLWRKSGHSCKWLWHSDTCLVSWVGEDTMLAMSMIFLQWSSQQVAIQLVMCVQCRFWLTCCLTAQACGNWGSQWQIPARQGALLTLLPSTHDQFQLTISLLVSLTSCHQAHMTNFNWQSVCLCHWLHIMTTCQRPQWRRGTIWAHSGEKEQRREKGALPTLPSCQKQRWTVFGTLRSCNLLVVGVQCSFWLASC